MLIDGLSVADAIASSATGTAAQRKSKAGEIARALLAEVDTITDRKDWRPAQKESRVREIRGHLEALESVHAGSAQRDAGARSVLDGGSALEAKAAGTKAVRGPKPPAPLDAPMDMWRELHAAAVGRKSFRAEIKAPFALSGMSPGLPSVIQPELTQQLPYEPDRLFEAFPGAGMDGPSIEYLVHSSNAAPAAAVAELGTKPDIGMVLTAKIATPTKIAGLASLSMEALEDFSHFVRFVPNELQRAVIDAETAEIVSGSGTAPHQLGLLHVPGTLTRAYPATPATGETALDTLELSINDLRVGPAFAKADLIAMHPGTLSSLRRIKDNMYRPILQQDLTEEGVQKVWGIRVITNSWIPTGTAIVADSSAVLAWTRRGMTIEQNGFGDTEWNTNMVSFRCEERIAIGVLRPAGLCIVTGLPTDTAATT